MRKSEDKRTGSPRRNRKESSIPMFVVANLLPLLILLVMGVGLVTGKLAFRENANIILEHIVIICVLFGILALVAWVGAPIILGTISRVGNYINITSSNMTSKPLSAIFSMPKYLGAILLYPILIVNLIALIILMLASIGAIVFYLVITIGKEL